MSDEKKCGIALDDYKLPIFRRELDAAGFAYEDMGELTPGTTLLQVKTSKVSKLSDLIFRCEKLCKQVRNAKR